MNNIQFPIKPRQFGKDLSYFNAIDHWSKLYAPLTNEMYNKALFTYIRLCKSNGFILK